MAQDIEMMSYNEETPLTEHNSMVPLRSSSSRLKCRGVGIPIGLLSASCYALAALFGKLLTGVINPIVITFVRSAILFFMFVIVMISMMQRFWIYSKKEYFVMVLLGVIDAIVVACQYYAFQMLHLGDALALLASSPVFISLINCIIMRQRCDFLQVFATILCFVGILLCIQPNVMFHAYSGEDKGNSYGYFYALGAALGWGVTFILTRHIDNVPIFVFLSFQSLVSVFVTGIYVLTSSTFNLSIHTYDIVYLFLTSLFSFGAINVIVLALKMDTPLMASIGRTFDIVIGFLFDICLFGRKPDWLSIIGTFLIFFGITVSAIIRGVQETQKLMITANSTCLEEDRSE